MSQSKALPRRAIIAGVIVALIIAIISFWTFHQDNATSATHPGTNVARATTLAHSPEDQNEAAEDTEAEKPVDPDAAPDDETAAGDASAADFSQAGTDGRFRFRGPLSLNLDYSVMPYSIPLNPPGPQASMVRWVDGLGYSPNTADKGTVYVLGHAWSQEYLAFNPISTAVVDSAAWSSPDTVTGTDGMPVTRYHSDALNGGVITMTNDQGQTREWVVDGAYTIPKTDAIADPELMNEEVPGKIVVIACAVADDADLEYNVVVTGHLR
ncbi:MAG: sortase [Corynebacterium sp.]|nr:sortase [Corynebacterium sp.]